MRFFGTPPRFGHSRASNCSAVEINRWKIVTDAGKEIPELCPYLPAPHRNPENRLSPVTPHLGGKNKVLIPQGLEVLSLLFPAEKLMFEEEEEVVHEHSQ